MYKRATCWVLKADTRHNQKRIREFGRELMIDLHLAYRSSACQRITPEGAQFIFFSEEGFLSLRSIPGDDVWILILSTVIEHDCAVAERLFSLCNLEVEKRTDLLKQIAVRT